MTLQDNQDDMRCWRLYSENIVLIEQQKKLYKRLHFPFEIGFKAPYFQSRFSVQRLAHYFSWVPLQAASPKYNPYKRMWALLEVLE